MNKQILLFLLLFVPFSFLYAQSNCAENVETASKYLNQGKISDAVNLVRPCSKDVGNLSRPLAYRILSIASILENKEDSALYFAKQMLELNPLYKPNLLNDPKSFTVLLQKIDIIPKFSLGLAFMYGLNLTFPQVTGTYIPTNYNKAYSNKGGYQLGLVTGYNFNSHHGVDLNIISNSKKYSIKYTSYGKQFEIDETVNTIDIPLLYKYTFFPKKRLKFNIMAGGYASFLLNSYNDLSSTDSFQTTEVKRYSSKVRRNAFNYGIIGGAGLVYKIGPGHLSLDVRYLKSLSNITKTDGRYDNATLIYDYDYLDDDIQLDNVAVSLGYHFYLNYKVSQ